MESDEKPKRVKVGFEITEFMSSDIDILYKELGYNDRAEFMRDAIREKIDRIKKESGYDSVKRMTKEKKVDH
jgi:metal-responsive CopG/Arc/MetJ family transcriptional regulator